MSTKDIGREPVTCFVVMPFGAVPDRYYSQIYEPAIEDAGLLAARADDAFRAGSVLQEIVDMLMRSTVVLADISEANRNVHYELGLAHALGKPTILVAPEGLQLFFDIGQERRLTYDKDSPSWGADLRSRIARAIKQTVQSPDTAIPTAFMHIKPSRLGVDEVAMRLRRIEERLTEIVANGQPGRPRFDSSLQDKIYSLPVAEKEAERLLHSMDQKAALQSLLNEGYKRAMAESAVATAAARVFRST
jgi:hypothetical protein